MTSQQRWKIKHPDYQKKSNDSRRKHHWMLTDGAKNVPCNRCGQRFPPYCMDFHHRNPAEKLFSIGGTIMSKTPAKILAEIAKCDVLCAICHRIVEHGE